MQKLIAQDCASSYWSIFELPSGNVEVVVYEDAGHLEAMNAAGLMFPHLPVCDSWHTDDGAEVVLLGYPNPQEW